MDMHNVPINDLVESTAVKLKEVEQITPPEWSKFCKTGMHKERPPVNPDWWYVRAASILRKIQLLGPVGVGKLRRKYGGRKNRGVAADKSFQGSGNIVRKILQQLEAAGLAKQAIKGTHKGRVITPKGLSLLAQTAKEYGKK
ncbi:30S ribosomal protein S19e [Candidatus Woesearchaeota archaeon]|nr:30S ribosomal protein S19e [Candidatus Woesearchaeota archaeon]